MQGKFKLKEGTLTLSSFQNPEIHLHLSMKNLISTPFPLSCLYAPNIYRISHYLFSHGDMLSFLFNLT